MLSAVGGACYCFVAVLIEADLRSIEYSLAPDALDEAFAAGAALREAQIRAAKALVRVMRGRSQFGIGCASIVQFGARMGLAPVEARQLMRLGQALEVQPSLEERIVARALSVPAAAAIAPVLRLLDGAESDELRAELPLWCEEAERLSLSELRKRARRRVEEERTGERVIDLTLPIGETLREDFERARVLASRKEKRTLSFTQTLDAVVNHYLDTFDPFRQEDGTRRVGPTSTRPGDRYIPVSVRRAVRRRAGDRCEHPGCDALTLLEFAHREPHRDGSGREVDDLFLLCWWHHTAYDGGGIRVLGPTGEPIWMDPSGMIVSRRDPCGRWPETDAEWGLLRSMHDGAIPTSWTMPANVAAVAERLNRQVAARGRPLAVMGAHPTGALPTERASQRSPPSCASP